MFHFQIGSSCLTTVQLLAALTSLVGQTAACILRAYLEFHQIRGKRTQICAEDDEICGCAVSIAPTSLRLRKKLVPSLSWSILKIYEFVENIFTEVRCLDIFYLFILIYPHTLTTACLLPSCMILNEFVPCLF